MTTSAASSAAATAASLTLNNMNRLETHKLYMTLLQFSLYDNPYKHYSRKIKLKKVPPLHSGASASASASHSGTPVEYIIASSYPSSASSSLRSADTSAATTTIKTRKKMKVTGAPPSTEIEPECEPESPKCNKIVEEEQQTNIIIFKPIEHEKMKNTKYSLSELKTLCTHYGIKKSGTKPRLWKLSKMTGPAANSGDHFLMGVQSSPEKGDSNLQVWGTSEHFLPRISQILKHGHDLWKRAPVLFDVRFKDLVQPEAVQRVHAIAKFVPLLQIQRLLKLAKNAVGTH